MRHVNVEWWDRNGAETTVLALTAGTFQHEATTSTGCSSSMRVHAQLTTWEQFERFTVLRHRAHHRIRAAGRV
jgi:hypothetical protein